MTIEQVIEVVKEASPCPVTAETELSGLGLDSLEFLDLLVRVGIPDAVAPSLHTVNDLYLAQQ